MKKHTCADCGKKFASENAVASHKKAKHPDHSSLRQKREEKEDAKKERKEAGLLRLAAREEERKTQKLIKEAEENYRRFGERGVVELTCAEYFAKSLKRLLKNKLPRGAGNEDKCFCFPNVYQTSSCIDSIDGDHAASELAKALQGNTTLEGLRLEHQDGVGQKGVIELARMLQGNTTLKHLGIQNTRFCPAASLAISKMSVRLSLSLAHALSPSPPPHPPSHTLPAAISVCSSGFLYLRLQQVR